MRIGRHAVRHRGHVNRLQLSLSLFPVKQKKILLMTEPDALWPAAIEEIVAMSRACFVVAAPYPSRGTVCQRRSTIDPIERSMTIRHPVRWPWTASKHVPLRFFIKIHGHRKRRNPVEPWSNFERNAILHLMLLEHPLIESINHKFEAQRCLSVPGRFSKQCFTGCFFRTKTTPKNGETPQRQGLHGVLKK